MRSTFFFALIVTAAVILASCNATDNTAKVENKKPAGPETIYPEKRRGDCCRRAKPGIV
jgi:PBP1b-binding outer membrane lipoprotein LpoB